MFGNMKVESLADLTVRAPISNLAILAAIKDLTASTAGFGFDLSSAAITQVPDFGVVKLNQKAVKLHHFLWANGASKSKIIEICSILMKFCTASHLLVNPISYGFVWRKA